MLCSIFVHTVVDVYLWYTCRHYDSLYWKCGKITRIKNVRVCKNVTHFITLLIDDFGYPCEKCCHWLISIHNVDEMVIFMGQYSVWYLLYKTTQMNVVYTVKRALLQNGERNLISIRKHGGIQLIYPNTKSINLFYWWTSSSLIHLLWTYWIIVANKNDPAFHLMFW